MSENQTEPNEVREIRINPIVPSESVLVATARSMRPKKAEELAPRDTRKHVETCPFCRGNEHKTPPVILSWPPVGDWQIRMVENLYPVLGDDREQSSFNFGLQQTIDGYGRHEVIIDHHEHGIAFILGVTPLAVSSGAGAASRHSIATGVIGGMLAATFVATFFVPVFFRWIAAWGRKRRVAAPQAAPGN